MAPPTKTTAEADAIARGIPEFSTVRDLAQLFSVTAETIRSWASSGRLEALKTSRGRGGRLRFARVHVLQLVESMAP